LQPDRHQPVPLAGKTVLMNGAAAGVRHFALQLAKCRGHASSPLPQDTMRRFCATLARNVDLVVDVVGGAATARFLPTLRRGGALFPIFPLGFDGAADAQKLGMTVSATQVSSNGAQLAEIAPLFSDGTLCVEIDSVFALADARQAYARAARGHIRVKIVL
jgi:NADPH:quinone reductase-like Zn-dependent oxidoreductase